MYQRPHSHPLFSNPGNSDMTIHLLTYDGSDDGDDDLSIGRAVFPSISLRCRRPP